jgi:transmembrane sensor
MRYDRAARMTDHTPTSLPPSVREQAVQWIVRIHSGSATDGDRRAWEAWLAAKPEHRHEFEQVSRMWSALDHAESSLKKEIDKAEEFWIQQAASRQGSRRFRWSSAWTTFAGVTLGFLILTVWWWTLPPEAIQYETAKGAQRQVILADGSAVMLNTDTKMTVQFSRGSRVISLDRGEAWFTVKHDERRPFTVQVANGAIRDIGTQFIVNKLAHNVRVSVWEGIVEVGTQGFGESVAAARPVMLHAGEQLSYGMDGRLSDIGLFERDEVGSWKGGKLIFRSQPLQHVLAEIMRYREEDIRLLDQTLEEYPVSGVCDIHDIETFLQLLQDVLPVRAQRVRGNVILLERAPASSAAPALSYR